MTKKYVLSKGTSAFFNADTKTWNEDSQITIWGSSDSLLQSLQNMIFENTIDSNDHSIHIKEIGFIYGDTGCMLCDFVNNSKEKELVSSALGKLNKSEVDALVNEFRRSHKI